MKKKTFRHYFFPRILAYTGKYLLRMTLFTCRIQTHGLNSFLSYVKANKSILALWHNRLGIITELFRLKTPNVPYTGFISNSKDGEVAAVLTESYPGGTAVRVPHDQKKQALSRVIQRLKLSKDVGVITPDGPRGPRYEVKPGIVIVAKEAGSSIIPFSWTASSFWQFKTWDGFLFPKPFSTIVVSWGNPISPEDPADLEEKLLLHDQLTCQKLSQNPAHWPK